MISEILVACFMVIDIILIRYTVKAYQMKTPISLDVAAILGMAAAAILCYCLTLVSREYFWLSMAYSLNFICFDGMIYFLYLFSRKYTSSKPLSKGKRNLLWLAMGCDALSLCLNPFLGHVVTFGVRNVNEKIFSIVEMKLPYRIHLILCYLLFALCIVQLIIKSIKSAYIYKMKYELLCVVLLTIAFTNGLFVFTKLSVDFSMLTYALAGVLIYHFTLNYIPNKLQMGILDYFMRISEDGIVVFDADGTCIYANPEASALFGQAGEIQDKEAFCRKWNISAAREERKIPYEEEIRSFMFTYKTMDDDSGKAMGSVFCARDITKEKKWAQEKTFLSKYDSLTRIYNRNYFFYRTAQLLDNTDETMVMAAMNVERFKLINDVYGFETGNLLLGEIARSLEKLNAGSYVYGRIDSDRFAVCLPKQYVTQELLEKCRLESLEVNNTTFPVVINFGVYEIDDKTIPAAVMYDRAMLALNQVKGLYYTNVGYYDVNLRTRLLDEQVILNDMEKAILEKQFIVYLQPQMNHASGQIVGAEALVRWNHPDRGMISPAEFVPLFEESGFITKLDQYVWDCVCRMIQKMRQEGKENCSISVNISTKDFYYADLYEVFTGLIQQYQIPPKSLKLEITETAFVLDQEKQMALVKKLQEAGFIIEMDDFGSGYSSLNTLKDIPVDVLKMDMKFLSENQDIERSKNILKMVVSLSKSLGMQVIAEGVETKSQADYLSGIGCENIQGFYYAKPMKPEEYEEYLSRYEYRDIMTGTLE